MRSSKSRVQNESKILTVAELSEYLRVHPSTIYKLLRMKKIPGFRIGSDWRFNIESIDKWRDEKEVLGDRVL